MSLFLYPKMNLFQELQTLLKSQFNGIKLIQPLFFNKIPAIRFDLQLRVFDTGDDDYMQEVEKRISKISSCIFGEEDDVLLYYNVYAWKKRKIRKTGYLFKQFNEVSNLHYQFKKRKYPTYDHGFNKGNRACQLIIKEKAKNINFKNIFKGIANNDFFVRPRIDGEVYFVNRSKNTILLMYDDRGCDLISNDVAFLSNVYVELSELILEINREDIKTRLYIS